MDLLKYFICFFIFQSFNIIATFEDQHIHRELKASIEAIKLSCGEVCNQKSIDVNGPFFIQPLKKSVDCENLFKESNIDKKSVFNNPPMRIPKWLVPYYAYNGLVSISNIYRDDKNKNFDYAFFWSQDVLTFLNDKYLNKTLKGKVSQYLLSEM